MIARAVTRRNWWALARAGAIALPAGEALVPTGRSGGARWLATRPPDGSDADWNEGRGRAPLVRPENWQSQLYV